MELVRRRPGSPIAVALMSAAGGLLLGSAAAALSPGMVARTSSLIAGALPAPQSPGAGSSRTAPTVNLQILKLQGRQIRHYTARPRTEAPWPVVVLIHTAWGLDDDLRKVADRLAEEGFLVVAPDLHGKVALDADKARELGAILDEERAVAALDSLAAYMKFRPEAGDHRVGAVGLDMGGRLALLAAMGSTDLSAVVTVAGAPITDADRLRRIPCPVLGLFGAADPVIPAAQVDAFRAALEKARRTAEVLALDNAGHHLLGAAAERQAPEAAAAAWSRMVSFLRSHL